MAESQGSAIERTDNPPSSPTYAELEHKPWEGPDGHLWLLSMVRYLLSHGDGLGSIQRALEEPWKWRAEVTEYREACRATN